MPFEFKRLEIQSVTLITPKVFTDERGFFMETYQKDAFAKAGITGEFVQQNHSKSVKGVLRGLHYQKEPYAQAKLVRCIKGEIFDVAVDIRKNSPTFGKYVSATLSAENKSMLYIPRGFAHGFEVLSDEAEITYSIDNIYAKESESGIIWNDPSIKINWPIKSPILSEKDKKWPDTIGL
ncbi:MAG: dTDP-4-dehydrorhamnose 3,5-epimerase [Candidatus Parvarchaeota archaeon]|nr:dTDP-4-dehydrorhamnose 3,5-epimerase [Candidatus Parvarchaeum tengchongense]MCW1312493.1 dTDP-4-dehydrorhamnose 3,5-epimerase [Candidatus Parvarchaeum tengchongense]